MRKSFHACRPTRREVLAGSMGAACAATTDLVPAGGFFTAGQSRIRVGLVGCGGRGTGAAMQAAKADPSARIVAIGDLFEDHLSESARLLEHGLRDRFDCSPERRFVGHDAWRHVLAADLDAVILAATPWSRPVHFATAIARGLHVYAERPAAVDAEGVKRVLAACDEAKARGLVVMSGLAGRHHLPTIETLSRIRQGDIGRPLNAVCRAWLGLPWHRPARSTWTAEESRQRNWVTDGVLSGGPLLERHIDAIDRSLQAFGDVCPASAAPVGSGSRKAIRYQFADGAELVTEIVRSAHARPRIEERVVGTAGTADLVRCHIESAKRCTHEGATTAPCHTGNPWQTCMSAFVGAILAGSGGDGGGPLCRSTLVALLGRTALETGREVAWGEVAAPIASLTAII